jgi:hypothetical protein
MSLPVLLFDLRARRTAELDRPEARQALALHRFALLDPPLTLELVAVCEVHFAFAAGRIGSTLPICRPHLAPPVP